MAQVGFTTETARFIRSYIDSVGTLEILLLLFGPPMPVLSCAQINETLRSNAESVEQRLAKLIKQGLVVAEQGEPKRFRFAPATEDLAQNTAALASVYVNYRERVIDTIYAPQAFMRNFADAFRIRKDMENDG